MKSDPRLRRIDPSRLKVVNDCGVDTTLFANEQVPVESAAVDELLHFIALQRTVEHLAEHAPGFFETEPALRKVAVTPDFHKAAGIPVGTVMATEGYLVPQAIGNDINCGMRLHVTALGGDAIAAKLNELETACRSVYFEGGRNIPMTRPQRDALFREGLIGLANAVPKSQREGLWSAFHDLNAAADLPRVHQGGSFPARHAFGLGDFLGRADGSPSRDNQIGSIGGGNHFVEFQRVRRVFDGPTAHAWGLKPGAVTVMVHAGSVSIGHRCGNHFRDVTRGTYPSHLKHPGNGVFILPDGDRHRASLEDFWDSMSNAANFAFANRMFLALMALDGLQTVLGRGALDGASLLYDAPHNLVWRTELEGRPTFLHRKGACPARGFEAMAGTPFEYYGEPVLVPGSMGASSFVLAGRGNAESLYSAAHGAGRALSRGDALKGDDAAFERFMREFRVVTPVDFRRPDVARRRDIVEKKLADIKKEAPFAYKGIGPVVQTLTDAGIAVPVAELKPLMTVKG